MLAVFCLPERGGGAGANSDEGIKSVDFLTSFFYSMTWVVAAKRHDKQI
jgi:hypothetical protein